MTLRRMILPLAACAALLATAGCGNDPGAGAGAKLAIATLKGGGGKGGGAAGAPDPAQLVANGLKSVKGPVILAIVEGSGAAAAMGQAGTNGAYVTWTTRDKQQLTFRSGVLSATRGLGNDLIASTAGALIPLIRGRQAGAGTRTHYYLNGEGTLYSRQARCQVTPGSTDGLQIGAVQVSTRRMTETCQGEGMTFENLYWVAADGTVWQSRQWIGPVAGHVVVQRLRK